MPRLFTDTTPFYVRDFEHPQILVSEGTPGTSPCLILRGDCTSFSYAPEKLIRPRRGTKHHLCAPDRIRMD